MAIAHTLKSCLDHERVPYQVIAHRHTATSLRAAETAHVDAGCMAKAVLLEEDLEHSHYVMAVLPASHRVVVPEVARRIGRQVHHATEEDAAGLFEDCETGANQARCLCVDASGLAAALPLTISLTSTRELAHCHDVMRTHPKPKVSICACTHFAC